MSKQKFNIWERTLELDIVYDCYSGESILDSQKSAFKEFCNQAGTVFESAKKKAEEYCLKTNRREIDTDYIENIFKYVKPKAIYVKASCTVITPITTAWWPSSATPVCRWRGRPC